MNRNVVFLGLRSMAKIIIARSIFQPNNRSAEKISDERNTQTEIADNNILL